MEYIVDGKKLTEEEFQALMNDPNFKLKKLDESTNSYKTLQKLNG